MPKPSSSEVTTQHHRRIFLQHGGPAPGNIPQFAGQDAQYMMLEGVTKPIKGGIEPIRVPHPNRLKEFKIVGRKASAPDFPTATLRLLEKHGQLPFALGDLTCPFNLYVPVGTCKDLSDFLAGWTDFVEIYSYAETTEADLGDRTAWEEDNQAEDGLSLTLDKIYAIGVLSLAQEAATQIDREVVDAVYGSDVECGECGPADDGTQKIYAVVKSSGAGSPGLPAEVIFTVDGGDTWSQVTIDGFGATEDPLAIDIVGDKLIVIGDGAYFWATISSVTGAPGTFTEVSSSFVAGNDPLDLFVLSPREVFFCGENGYIYRATDVTAGVSVMDAGVATTSSLLRIHGDGDETLVAVGAADTVIVSHDRGASWATTGDTPAGIALDIGAVAVLDRHLFWVGTLASGRLYYTLNGGETWIEKQFSGTGTGNLRDIVFATEEVGYFVHDTTGPTARIFATWDGGEDWALGGTTGKRFLIWPVFDRVNRLAVPQAGPAVSSNNVAIAGLAGDGTDGILLIGKATEF